MSILFCHQHSSLCTNSFSFSFKTHPTLFQFLALLSIFSPLVIALFEELEEEYIIWAVPLFLVLCANYSKLPSSSTCSTVIGFLGGFEDFFFFWEWTSLNTSLLSFEIEFWRDSIRFCYLIRASPSLVQISINSFVFGLSSPCWNGIPILEGSLEMLRKSQT